MVLYLGSILISYLNMLICTNIPIETVVSCGEIFGD